MRTPYRSLKQVPNDFTIYIERISFSVRLNVWRG
jgi:hypothetical protein